MNLFNRIKKTSQSNVAKDEGSTVDIKGIRFECDSWNAELENKAHKIADAYEEKISAIIDFIAADIEHYFMYVIKKLSINHYITH